VRASIWTRFLEEQRDRHGKVLFTVTELANVAGTSRVALNVELTRIRRQGVITRFAHGLYGMPGAVSPQDLVPAIDSHAYITGHYALCQHGLVTQTPVSITCFTDRRSPRGQNRVTPVGRLVFVCVQSRVYCPPSEGVIASPTQALCDFIYLARRHGAAPESLVTFRNLARTQVPDSSRVLARYPISVQKHVERLWRSAAARPGIR
jgi:hypothetical protein